MAADEGPYTAAVRNIMGVYDWETQVLMRELYQDVNPGYVYTMEALGGVEVWFQSFLTLLYGGELVTSRSGRFTPRGET